MRKTTLKLIKTKIKGQTFHLVVYPGLDGERTRKHFKSQSEAKEFRAQKLVELTNFGTAAAALDEHDRAEYLDCVNALAPFGISLRDAVKKLLPQLEAEKTTCSVKEAVEMVVKSKTVDGLSDRYIKDIKGRLEKFSNKFGASNLAAITTAEIDDWLRALPGALVNRNNYRRNIGVLFSYAEKRGLIVKNPINHVSKAKEITKKVGVLTPDQASKLLANADNEIQPAIALGLFAGLRTESEIWRLDWGNIDFEAGLIRVDAENTKIAANRFVPIPDILREWLKPHKQESGKVSPKGDEYFSLLQKARKGAEISKWPSNALRHSFGSYHYAKFQDMSKVMAEMGHTNSRTFLKHYRERVKPIDAEAFWQIRPLKLKTSSPVKKSTTKPSPPSLKKTRKRV